MSNQEMRKKVSSKADIGKASLDEMDIFGGGLRVPAYIQKELEEKGLVARFVSVKKVAEAGGYHPRGWTPYQIENPQPNVLTGQVDKTYRFGDLVLAVKTKQQAQQHRKLLDQRNAGQAQSHKNSLKEMRDKIREGRADKHISLFEGYEENGDDE
jgi:hypothetical protein